MFYLRDERDAEELVYSLEEEEGARKKKKQQATVIGGGYIGLELTAILVGW